MQKEPTLYIGKKPWYLGRFWINNDTEEVIEDTDSEDDSRRKEEKTNLFAGRFGLVPEDKFLRFGD